jgi:hypothetical protein
MNISILTSGFAACSATKIAPSCAPVGAQAQAEKPLLFSHDSIFPNIRLNDLTTDYRIALET